MGGEEGAGPGYSGGVVFVDAEVGVLLAGGEGTVAVTDGGLEVVEVGLFQGLGPEGVVGGGEVEVGAGGDFGQVCGGFFQGLGDGGIVELGHVGGEDGGDEG